MPLDEYKFTVLIDGQSYDGYSRIPQTPITIFNRTVLTYIELTDVSNVNIGVKKVTVEWPSQVFPYVLNPSNVIFKLDNEYVLQHGVTANINERKTEHIVATSEQFTELIIYVFNDTLCQSEETALGHIGDIKECNTFPMHFPRSFNDYVTTECNTFPMHFPRSFNGYVTTECNTFPMHFPRSFDYSISLE